MARRSAVLGWAMRPLVCCLSMIAGLAVVSLLAPACSNAGTNTGAILTPLLETFLTEILFGEKLDLFDPRLLGRISSQDVREHIRASLPAAESRYESPGISCGW